MIKEAEGQAEAILKVQQATADGLKFIKEAGADQSVLTLKSLEAFEGGKRPTAKATKIIIPSDIQGIGRTCQIHHGSGGRQRKETVTNRAACTVHADGLYFY